MAFFTFISERRARGAREMAGRSTHPRREPKAASGRSPSGRSHAIALLTHAPSPPRDGRLHLQGARTARSRWFSPRPEDGRLVQKRCAGGHRHRAGARRESRVMDARHSTGDREERGGRTGGASRARRTGGEEAAAGGKPSRPGENGSKKTKTPPTKTETPARKRAPARAVERRESRTVKKTKSPRPRSKSSRSAPVRTTGCQRGQSQCETRFERRPEEYAAGNGAARGGPRPEGEIPTVSVEPD